MVKARIGKTEIEGTPEEVAYILNGLLMAQEEDTEVMVEETLPPRITRQTFPRLKPSYKKRTLKNWHKVKYKKFLGSTLYKWVCLNFPNMAEGAGKHSNAKIIKALREAGVPYHIPKIKLGHSLDSVRNVLRTKAKAAPYTKEEVEEIEQDID